MSYTSEKNGLINLLDLKADGTIYHSCGSQEEVEELTEMFGKHKDDIVKEDATFHINFVVSLDEFNLDIIFQVSKADLLKEFQRKNNTLKA